MCLVESNGCLQPTIGFMTSVTYGLTAKKPGSALCPTLIIEYGTTLLCSGKNPLNFGTDPAQKAYLAGILVFCYNILHM